MKIRYLFQLVVGAFCLLWISKEVGLPAYAYLSYSDRYIELSGKCANAMDESWFVEQVGNSELDKTRVFNILCQPGFHRSM
ncbi:TIGR03982 family His-Xaa-Ser system protein [Nitrincola sp.]|uniref:TIGR03982 family His-Xaa-Ser system protein n=1 Tax=Nitrincola sp. TaxID=1926584 RepID=UPI003A8D160F